MRANIYLGDCSSGQPLRQHAVLHSISSPNGGKSQAQRKESQSRHEFLSDAWVEEKCIENEHETNV